MPDDDSKTGSRSSSGVGHFWITNGLSALLAAIVGAAATGIVPILIARSGVPIQVGGVQIAKQPAATATPFSSPPPSAAPAPSSGQQSGLVCPQGAIRAQGHVTVALNGERDLDALCVEASDNSFWDLSYVPGKLSSYDVHGIVLWTSSNPPSQQDCKNMLAQSGEQEVTASANSSFEFCSSTNGGRTVYGKATVSSSVIGADVTVWQK
ncbi:MAG: hypothetical protein M3170_02650 [Candidatus Dormibacteraeota bacterium]|nr:hypothetical protein [Candidatus Dormibacteraeota bacterium]